MFEEMTDRIAGTLLMGLDAAVEFATLGEFRIVEAEASPRPFDHQGFGATAPAPLVRRPQRATATPADRSLLPQPATALARAVQPPKARVAKAVVASAPRRRPGGVAPAAGATKRKRGGEVPAGSQLCLFSR